LLPNVAIFFPSFSLKTLYHSTPITSGLGVNKKTQLATARHLKRLAAEIHVRTYQMGYRAKHHIVAKRGEAFASISSLVQLISPANALPLL
jgi:hypothetical protein